jgi:hypothetical protein
LLILSANFSNSLRLVSTSLLGHRKTVQKHSVFSSPPD